jgi:two-component system phosphate regulon sensor histidine kinase PhoR
MMLLSVAGITWVQVVWIRNAVVTQKDNFDKLVFMSLNNAVREIETRSRMKFINDFPLSVQQPSADTSGFISGFFSIGSTFSNQGGEVKIDIRNNSSRVKSVNDENGRRRIVIEQDSSVYSDSVSFDLSSDGTVRQFVFRGDKGRGEASVPGSKMGKSEFEGWLKRRSGEFRSMSDQMINDMYQWERNLDISNAEVKEVLAKYFPVFGITTPFDLAVIRKGEFETEPTVKTSRNEFVKSRYAMKLFADNMFNNDVVLSVVFPQKTNYVLGSMAWILGGSMLFSLFIFATFALSIWFIVRQKKISEMKSDFINNMTHEFKTPIATISLAADTIMNPKILADEKSIRHFIGMIKKENSRMNKKVETILQIASLDKKEIEFRYEMTSLHSAIAKSLETIEIQIHEKGGTLISDLLAENDMIYGDQEHLVSLMNNLLDNAIKYSAESPYITISTRNRDEGIVVSVADRGIGMSKSTQGKIFERFYRQTSGNVHNVKGFGLGLNYVKDIVEAHKGSISVWSEPGKGSRFDIFLPLNTEN